MPSFAPCLHEEAESRIFARATEAAKRPYNKISSCAVDTDVVVWSYLWCNICEWINCGVGKKSLAIVGVKSNYLAFFHSLTGCNKTSFLLSRGKRWVSFPAVTVW